jgi:hypothetical protein
MMNLSESRAGSQYETVPPLGIVEVTGATVLGGFLATGLALAGLVVAGAVVGALVVAGAVVGGVVLTGTVVGGLVATGATVGGLVPSAAVVGGLVPAGLVLVAVDAHADIPVTTTRPRPIVTTRCRSARGLIAIIAPFPRDPAHQAVRQNYVRGARMDCRAGVTRMARRWSIQAVSWDAGIGRVR